MWVPEWVVVAVPLMFVALGVVAHGRDRLRRRMIDANVAMRTLRAIPQIEDARPHGDLVEFRTALGGGVLDLARRRVTAACSPSCPHLIFENDALRGRNLGLARLAFDEDIQHRVAALGVVRLSVEDGVLSVHTHKNADTILPAVLALAEVLPGDAWAGLALGLGLSRHGMLMKGAVQGVPVRVSATPEGQTVIEAAVRAGFHAQRVPPFEAAPLGHPILDGLIGVWAVEDRDRLDDAELVEALLEVVHGHPGSEVKPLGIRLVQDGLLVDELPSCIEKVVRLARVLDS